VRSGGGGRALPAPSASSDATPTARARDLRCAPARSIFCRSSRKSTTENRQPKPFPRAKRVPAALGPCGSTARLITKPVRVAKSTLAVRLLPAAVVAPVLVGMMFRGPALGWYAIVLGATGVGASELFCMTHPADKVAQGLGIVT